MTSLRTFLEANKRNNILTVFLVVYITSWHRRFSHIYVHRNFLACIPTCIIASDPSNGAIVRHVAWVKSRGVYCRRIKDKLGKFTGQVKYEPRLKRDKQFLSLGQYDTPDEAKIVHDIAANFYGNDEFGCLDFEDGRYLVGGKHSKGDRYFVIPPLTEKLEGKEKSKLVSLKAKEIHKQFKAKQAEYRKHRDISLATIPDMPGMVEVQVGGPSEGGRLDLINTALEHPSNKDHVGNLVVDGSMPYNSGVTSNISSHVDDTAEPTLFDSTNPLTLSVCYDMFEGSMDDVPALFGEDSRRKFEFSGNHIPRYGPTSSIAPDSFPNSAPGSGFNFNTCNEMGALLLQVVNNSQQEKQLFQQQLVNTLQQDKQELKQEKQELKRKIWELQTQLSELQREFREHILCCSGENRPSKKRGVVCGMGDLAGV